MHVKGFGKRKDEVRRHTSRTPVLPPSAKEPDSVLTTTLASFWYNDCLTVTKDVSDSLGPLSIFKEKQVNIEREPIRNCLKETFCVCSCRDFSTD